MNTTSAAAVTVGVSTDQSLPAITTDLRCPHCSGALLGHLPMTVEQQAERISRQRRGTQESRLHHIAETVATFYETTVNEMRKHRNDWEHLMPRQIAMYLMRQSSPDVTLSDIGRIFNRDHSTVLHNVRVVERDRVAELWVREDLARLGDALGIAA